MQKGLDYIGVAVVYFCHDGEGNFLMSHRNENCRDEKGNWDIGGGALEYGESVEHTLKKEIKEEYLTEVLGYQFLGFRNVHRELNGRKTHWIALDFKVLVDKEKAGNGEPHKFSEVKWFALKNLPPNLHSQLPNFLKLYVSKL